MTYAIARVSSAVALPPELNRWLTETVDATPGLSRNDLLVRAVYLLREVMGGVPGPVSLELLDDAVARVNTMIPPVNVRRRAVMRRSRARKKQRSSDS